MTASKCNGKSESPKSATWALSIINETMYTIDLKERTKRHAYLQLIVMMIVKMNIVYCILKAIEGDYV